MKSGYVKILETGEIVEVYHWYANGIGYITKNGIRFMKKGTYEEVEKDGQEK